MVTPQGWTRHTLGTFSVPLSLRRLAEKVSLRGFQKKKDEAKPKQKESGSK